VTPEALAGLPPGDGLGQWVRRWRHANRWTQEGLAEALGYDVSYVAKIERGSRRPTSQFLNRLATVAAVPIDDLLRIARRPSERVRLPLPELALIGRDQDIVELTGLVRGGARCVTLVGAPGIGKTSLAVEVGWTLADDFRHGACFVPLAEVADAADVAAALRHRLGLREVGGRPPLDVVVDALRDQAVLLLLDNFEHVLPAATVVQRLLDEAPNVRVLATSREALGLSEETSYRVNTLGFPDPLSETLDDAETYAAVRVFVDRSRVAQPNFALTEANRRPVVEICARLDGLPLAINITAAASRILSPADIARSLRDRLELPTDRGATPPTGGRLGSALAWSWELLGPTNQSLLARMGVFAGGCSLAAAETVCVDDGGDVLLGLTELENKSLVQATLTDDGASRFTCLETVRRYAIGRLSERGELHQLQRRHCAYFVGLAQTAEPMITGHRDQAVWLRRLDQEYANLAAAFAWALDNDRDRALTLAACLSRLFSRRRISEGRQWLRLALDQGTPRTVTAVRALTGLGVLARLQGDFDAAEAALDEARALAAALGAPAARELAAATLARGIVAEDRADYDTAETRFEEATALAVAAGDNRGTGHGLNCLGVIALRRDDIEAATSRFMEALSLFRALDDPWSVAVSATNLGWIAETAGELSEAAVWYEECTQLWGLVGDEHGLARAAADLGRVARLGRDFPRARLRLEEALRGFHRLGDRRLAAACMLQLADIAVERRRRDIAARLVGAAEAVRASLGAPAWPDEVVLEGRVLDELAPVMGRAALARARLVGRSFALEDAVDMVESDTWPPAYRGGRLAP
jgi:predicted ATPase